MKDYVEIRAVEKKPELKDELAIFGKWLILFAGLFVVGAIMLLGLSAFFA